MTRNPSRGMLVVRENVEKQQHSDSSNIFKNNNDIFIQKNKIYEALYVGRSSVPSGIRRSSASRAHARKEKARTGKGPRQSERLRNPEPQSASAVTRGHFKWESRIRVVDEDKDEKDKRKDKRFKPKEETSECDEWSRDLVSFIF